jgi:hypothetical protein
MLPGMSTVETVGGIVTDIKNKDFDSLAYKAGGATATVAEMGVMYTANAAVSAAQSGLAAKFTSSKPSSFTETHGNSLKSTKTQHGYEIYDNSKNGDVVKTGISGQKLNLNGTSPRANSQVNAWNRAAGYNQYGARVVATNIPGREAAISWERANALKLYDAGNSMSRHIRPAPWLDN